MGNCASCVFWNANFMPVSKCARCVPKHDCFNTKENQKGETMANTNIIKGEVKIAG